jgi:hypothetical protein
MNLILLPFGMLTNRKYLILGVISSVKQICARKFL